MSDLNRIAEGVAIEVKIVRSEMGSVTLIERISGVVGLEYAAM